jgi:hypothetical protein
MIDLDYSDPYAPQLAADPIVTSGHIGGTVRPGARPAPAV